VASASASSPPSVLFGPFEYDVAAAELRKHGTRIRLQGQPLQILSALLKQPGQVVTRDDLKQQLWQDATFGDFEHGLNAAVNKLRQALGDSADQPRYVETLPGRGYRFIAPVQRPSLAPLFLPLAVEKKSKADPAPKRILPWAIASVLAMIAAAALGLLWRATRPVSQPLVRLSLELPDFTPTPEVYPGASFALSPDGTRVVYTNRGKDGTFRLYTRTLDQEQAMPLAGTEGAYGPFFSPDSRAVGFFAGGKLKKALIEPGGVVVLCDAPKGAGGSWGDDDNIIAALGSFGALSRIPSRGGEVRPVTKLKEVRDFAHNWPQVLPGAQAVLFTAVPTTADIGDATIEVQSLRTGERKTLVHAGLYGRYVPSGHLVYSREGKLYAAPMDEKRLALTGPSVPVIDDVATSGNIGFAQMDFSPSGTLIYMRGQAQKLVWLDSNGRTQPLRATPAEYNPALRFSPDGKRLSMSVIGKDNVDVWVYEWERDAMTRLTFNSYAFFPVWSPNGKHIAFTSAKEGDASNLYYMRADGAGPAVRLTNSKNRQVPYSFSPDGKRLAFFEFDPRTKVDIWTLPLADLESDHPKVGKPEPFLVTSSDERAPMFSPDGRWLAYESDESGRSEVYVRPFPGPGGNWQISTDGGDRPVWSKKGPELFYRSSEGMMVASYKVNGAALVASKPRLWAAKNDLGTYFDLAPDGKRFAVLQPAAASEHGGSEHVMLLQNFFDELRRRAPAGGR
jgi:Tol biopolymer transport system component/DNA-binding winged helix-turn-helix (wHTH) protein